MTRTFLDSICCDANLEAAPSHHEAALERESGTAVSA